MMHDDYDDDKRLFWFCVWAQNRTAELRSFLSHYHY
jgi:hypothetical protein